MRRLSPTRLLHRLMKAGSRTISLRTAWTAEPTSPLDRAATTCSAIWRATPCILTMVVSVASPATLITTDTGEAVLLFPAPLALTPREPSAARDKGMIASGPASPMTPERLPALNAVEPLTMPPSANATVGAQEPKPAPLPPAPAKPPRMLEMRLVNGLPYADVLAPGVPATVSPMDAISGLIV